MKCAVTYTESAAFVLVAIRRGPLREALFGGLIRGEKCSKRKEINGNTLSAWRESLSITSADGRQVAE